MSETKLYLVLAALYGASGVALLAVGSHAAPGNATIAGQILLFHAPALIAITAARDTGHLHGLLGRLAIALLVIGVGVFSADLVLRGFGIGRLFPMAAPLGGSFTIFGWIVLAAAAALGHARRQD
jgi:uncharacterized membrane protein YgdD (TMEM256/DUF423 family)